MKKVKVLLFLLIVSLSLSPVTAFARLDPGSGTALDKIDSGGNKNGIDTSYSLGSFPCGEPLISDDVKEQIEKYKEDEANMAEKFLTSQVENVFNIGDINGMSTLVFGNPYCIWAGKKAEMSADGIFTIDERKKIIDPLLKLFGSVFFLVLILSMLLTGLKTMGNSVRGQAMDEFWSDAKMWIVALFLAFFYNHLTNWLFQINAAIVLDIKGLLEAQTDNLDNISTMSSVTDFFPALMGSFLIVALGEWVLAGILNVVYLARKVIILLLLVLGMVAIYSLMFAKTRAFFGNWFRELLGNVFLQSIHAIVFYGMIMFAELGASPFFKIGLMIMFIPISGMISKLLNIGDSSTKVGSALTMVGLGGMVSTMMLASQAKSVMYGGSLSNGGLFNNNNSTSSSGGDSLTSLANSLANDSASTSISSSAAGTNSSLFNMAKETGSKLGGFVGGGAGVVAGPIGAGIGAKVGGAVGGGLVQMGRNMGVGISNIHSNFNQARKFSNENGTGFKALFGSNANFDTLNARRQTMGNFGESIGVMLAGQRGAAIGRNAGFALSGVSRQRLANEMSSSFNMRDASGNLQATTFNAIAQKYPNADMKWMQTNQGSGFYVSTNDGWKQVGLTGSADSSLKDGQARVMDYKLADPSLNYEYQSNGTYKAPSQSSSLSEAAVTSPVNTTFDSSMASNISSVPTFEEAMAGGHVAAPLGSSFNGSVSSIDSVVSNSSSTQSGVTDTSAVFNQQSTTGLTDSVTSVSGSNVNATTDSAARVDSYTPLSDVSQPSLTNSSLNTLPPQSIQGTNAQEQRMETVGLQGSTPSVMRKSEAYIVNTGESNLAMNPKTVQQVASSNVAKHQDPGFNAKKVNPDAYVYHNVSGADTRTSSDRAADKVHEVSKISNVWKSKAQNQAKSQRVKKIV
ncbi:type IV secretion system protein [Lysinibacillus sp. K60]|uniref:type IV secretion system protein n=1 Tax=Lysinibacillus sp. K60 TaxID=2720027 RepID=UPI001C8B9E18|nr:type IV secretion system protein [Lysinibacillus sp. K60]MBX8945958.1 type IV secretion system protein [Lysinibacillus sp. K60]